jgi:hypothetical protein
MKDLIFFPPPCNRKLEEYTPVTPPHPIGYRPLSGHCLRPESPFSSLLQLAAMETPGLKSNYSVALKTGLGEWHALSNIKMTGWRFLWKLRHQLKV